MTPSVNLAHFASKFAIISLSIPTVTSRSSDISEEALAQGALVEEAMGKTGTPKDILGFLVAGALDFC